ncbi:IclR family transcriptional regulator [Chelativorans sp. Marseille-P2723]|uniref:IclR family transcriptional regulator n=1 Tax=Chelativorans sp. Marseille-P2723 TaxID=2709133 RepID=UPI00156F62AD|nr:IclR family transcriptional regulator [Chelativorans sp. Marseille-P2723]
MNSHRKDIVRAAETTLAVLEVVAFSEEELGVTQIAQRLSLSKGAVFRHLQGLVDRGFVAQDPITSRYRLGVKASLIGRIAPPANDLASAAEGPMRDTRDRTAITTVLSAPTVSGALVLATIIGYRTIEIGVRKGSELPFHASAQGKVMLAFGPPTLMERTLRLGLPALTPHTITDPDQLVTEVAAISKRGFATAPEEALLGINTIAAPVFDRSGQLVGAAALCGSIQYVPADHDEELAGLAQEMAARISRTLGYEG